MNHYLNRFVQNADLLQNTPPLKSGAWKHMAFDSLVSLFGTFFVVVGYVKLN